MSEVQLVRKSEENFYINLDLYNDKDYNVPCKANIVSSDAILQSGESYQCAFIRGLVPLSAVPYFTSTDIIPIIGTYVPTGVPQIQKHHATYINQYYTPTDPSDRGVYSIASYLKAINAGLEYCIATSYFGVTRPAEAAANTVKFTYDGDKFSFECLAGFPALNIEIWLNDDLQNLLGGFEYFRAPVHHQYLSNCRYQLRYGEFLVNNKMTEQESSVNNWNTNDTLLFASTKLPLVNEQSGSFTGTAASVPISILTDFFTAGVNFKVPLTIIPINNRYVALDRCPNTYSLDIETYIRTKNGAIKQLMVAPGQHFSVKLEFRKN